MGGTTAGQPSNTARPALVPATNRQSEHFLRRCPDGEAFAPAPEPTGSSPIVLTGVEEPQAEHPKPASPGHTSEAR